MNGFVLDASVALDWFLAEEAQEQAWHKRALMDDLVAIVPPIWHLEVINTVLQYAGRGRMTESLARIVISEMLTLPFAVRDESGPDAIVGLALAHGLSAYDATYLDLAIASGWPLATLDKELIRAAEAVGVPLA